MHTKTTLYTNIQKKIVFLKVALMVQNKLHIYITIRVIGIQVMVENRKSLTMNNIGSEFQPLLTSSIKPTNLKRINRNGLRGMEVKERKGLG